MNDNQLTKSINYIVNVDEWCFFPDESNLKIRSIPLESKKYSTELTRNKKRTFWGTKGSFLLTIYQIVIIVILNILM